jgi:hypothetical protein
VQRDRCRPTGDPCIHARCRVAVEAGEPSHPRRAVGRDHRPTIGSPAPGIRAEGPLRPEQVPTHRLARHRVPHSGAAEEKMRQNTSCRRDTSSVAALGRPVTSRLSVLISRYHCTPMIYCNLPLSIASTIRHSYVRSREPSGTRRTCPDAASDTS